MKTYSVDNMILGWFIGNFEPSVLRTTEFEVGYKTHSAGERWDKHYHAIATEINYLIRGKMKINDQTFESPVIFVIEPGEIADPEFLTDVELIVVKTPSVIGDKYSIDR